MSKRTTLILGLVAAGLFVLTVWLANWAITRWGAVSVGFGLTAPAGVYFAGLAFTLRDVVHRCLGGYWVVIAIGVGAGLSALIAPRYALASAVAFGVSEIADFAVYTPLRERGWLAAVVASNAVGIAVDSLLFLWIAFGSLAYFNGQVVGKAWMTALAVGLLFAVERWRGREAVPA